MAPLAVYRATLLVVLLGSAAAASPTVEVRVPPRMATWARTEAKVIVHNTARAPLVPLAIEVASDAGTLAAWGTEGTCRGAVRGCSVQSRWAFAAPARQHGATWELLLGGPPPMQRAEPPDALSEQITDHLERLAPIAPGESVELTVPVVARYQHGGALTVTMRYVAVDPKRLALCSAAAPPHKAFVPCRTVKQLGGTLYARRPELASAARSVSASARFDVDTPAFDLAQARARAKVPSGAFGYERRRGRWILVDGARTVVAGATGALEVLPGDWLDVLESLDGQGPVSTYWNATPADAPKIVKRLRKARLDHAPFSFKGHTSADRFIVTITRRDVAALAASMRALGYRMSNGDIIK